MTTRPYIIIDDNQENILETKAMASRFRNLQFAGFAHNYDDGINLILEFRPEIVFLEIDPDGSDSNLSLKLIDELHRYLRVLPKIVITTKDKALAFDAIKYEVSDYLVKPIEITDFRKAIFKIERLLSDGAVENRAARVIALPNEEPAASVSNGIMLPVATIDSSPIVGDSAVEEVTAPPLEIKLAPDEKPLTICVKSYGDYRFINADDICYLQADNNSTDIHLNNGEMITAFKTLKHFENVLSSPFVRIHNSYIVNIDYVSRIHTGNSVCYIKNTTTKLPFSKSYKENIDAILNSITKGNYLEI